MREPKEMPKQWFERDVVYGKYIDLYAQKISHRTKKGLSRKHRRRAKVELRKQIREEL